MMHVDRPHKFATWAVLTAAALVVLLARIFPDAVEHRGQIDAAGAEVAVCAARAHSPSDGGTETLEQLADCAQGNDQVRRELGDILSTLVVLTFTAAGVWHMTSSKRHHDHRSPGRA